MAGCTLVHILSLLALVQWSSLAEASHFRHGSISWAPTDSNGNTIRFTFRLAFRRSFSHSYYCDENTVSQGNIIGSGDSWNAKCANPSQSIIRAADTGFRCTDFSRNDDWSMGQNNFTYTLPSSCISQEWIISYHSCCWISNLVRYANSDWLVSTNISLSRRSDNGKINSSPVSKSTAIARFQHGCQKSLRIPVEDPDGDFVKCRWATRPESSIPGDSCPYTVLDETNCILTYRGHGTVGTYAVTLTLEDFPAGTTNFNNIRPFSAVPLQFLVIIISGSGSCDDIPVFTVSTPQDGECSEVQIGSAYRAVIEVRLANFAKHVVEITTSSPSGMHLTSLRYHGGIYYRNVTWYPNQNQIGQQLFCFQALDSSGLQSEWRCVTILVGLSNTPHVILGTQWPINPISETGPGLISWSIHFDRVIKKPRSPSHIRLVLQSSSHTVFKVDTLSRYVSIDSNRTVLYFSMPKAALSMNGSYAILIDHGAVVGQGCSYDGPPTPGITSTRDWGFTVNGVCPLGYALAPPSFTKCADINECGGHHRSKRAWWWYSSTSPSATYSGQSAFASVVPSYASECYHHSYLEDMERGMGFYNGEDYLTCDRSLASGWYRFRGAAGTQMPTTCVGERRCSTHAPGWLNGTHPSVADGIVHARVCFHWWSDCCQWSTYIRVRNCSGFYVYELGPAPTCWLRYCGNGGANYSMSSITNISPTPAASISPAASAQLPAVPVSCLYHLHAPQGYFNSPNYPQHYHHNLYCAWVITVTPGHYIYLRFDHFHLEGTQGICPYDYVRIYDGTSYQSLTMRRCDYQDSWCVYSHSNVLYVYFVTDGSVSRSGFKAYYERVYETYSVCSIANSSHYFPPSNIANISPTPVSLSPTASASFPAPCLYNLGGSHGYFNSPNYPQYYHHNLYCAWVISVTPGYYIYLRFDRFHLQGSQGSCPYDYVRIYDGPYYQSLTMRRCDYQDSWCVYSHSNILYVHFVTDGSVSRPGFTAYYERVHDRYSVCPHVNSSIHSAITPTSAGPFASATTVPSYGSECYNYYYLQDAERRMDFYNGYSGYIQCDSHLTFGWYRFRGAAGTQMPTSCVGMNRCGTHAPGWLNRVHPSVADGMVNATVCFHWNSDCCEWYTNIRVRNCGGFYVYELGPPPHCHSRYCGNGGGYYSTNNILPTPVQSSAAVATPIIPGVSNCSHHFNQTSGYFTSPNHPGCYPNTKYCTWLLEAPAGKYIYLHFSSFHLEYGASNCPWDFVQVFDGDSLHSPSLIKACGQLAPWGLFSSGRFLVVLFYSDNIIMMPGFSVSYYAWSYKYSVALPSQQVSIASPVQCFPTQTQTATPAASNVHGIHPTPASSMPTNFYATSSVNVLPDPSQFEFHLPSECEQTCHNTLGSYTCSCVSGYRLAADGKSCSDVDECSTNNGGCSHHCFNVPGSFYCGCPEGTSMGANNLTCVEPGVSVDCGASNMTVSLEKKTFPFFDVARLHLRYSSCRATQNATHLLISTPLNGCGTQINETQDALIFWNEIKVDVVIIDYVITRTHDIKLPFYCSYSRKKMLSLSFKPQHLHFGTEAGYGNFTFKMDFYKSSSFATPYAQHDYPLKVALNDKLYVRYSVESSADLVIMAVSCKSTKDGSSFSWPRYSIIENGCPQDTTMEYSYDPTRNYQQFKFGAFRFFEGYATVYIHCEVVACHRYSPNSRCRKGCERNNKRKRRDVTRDEIEHDESTTKVTLTRGPLIIQEENQKSGETGQNKQQTALIGGVAGAGGVGLIAVIALAVLFVKYRIARRFMNRNKVGDMYTTQDEQLSRRNAYVQPEDMIEQEDAM